MKETHYTISPIQSKYLEKFHNMLNGYYVKGNTHYYPHMGYKLDMRDCISLLDNILYTNYYTNRDKDQLNEIRSMYISLTNEKVS